MTGITPFPSAPLPLPFSQTPHLFPIPLPYLEKAGEEKGEGHKRPSFLTIWSHACASSSFSSDLISQTNPTKILFHARP